MKRLAAMTQVLLVDDDVELGEMLTEYLEREGFGATAVADGEAGVRGALSGEYGIVVLDVMMPRLNGIEALRRFSGEGEAVVKVRAELLHRAVTGRDGPAGR